MRYAEVLLQLPYEASYSYIVPEKIEGKAVFGTRCIVPFGKRTMTGFIISVSDEKPSGDFALREIIRMIDDSPVFNEALLDIARWMGRMYFSPAGLSLSMMIPSGRRESEISPFYEPVSFRRIETLTSDQEHALSQLREGNGGVYYLFGATGSGKSEVYLRRAEDKISEGKQVLYLVPEITLTEQLSEEVYSRFSGRVAILHSSLTPSQRLKAWHQIINGEVDLVIGARSSVFAPFRNLGLIILDEEHETSYKSGNAPRYHARQVAQYRAGKEHAEFIMGSATPSLEAWKLMSEHKIHRIDMKTRAGGGSFPRVDIVNIRGEKGNISAELEKAMREALADKKGVLLFLNRRGYTYGYVCSSCGHVLTCPNCSVSLTYHKKGSKLVCHTCGYTCQASRVCPECGSYDLSPRGFGTENIEEEIRGLFPYARVARLDTDTASEKKGNVQEILHGFRDGEIDILLGTQMIAKGLNFPSISLVGVINADSSLSLPDFRAAERTFDLIHQVAGRAGRYRDDGRVIIQTSDPMAPAVRCAAENDLESFYRIEMKNRKDTLFPPYSRLVNLTVRGRDESRTRDGAEEIERIAWKLEERYEDVEVFSASPSPIERKAMYYRYHVLLRSVSASALLKFTSELLAMLSLHSSLYLEIDTDPVSLA